MRIVILILFIHVGCLLMAQQPLPAVGSWREHLPYNKAIDLAAGNARIYCATPYSYFTLTKADQSIERMSRITGLAETGISAIDYDATADRLLIGYTNSNIDVVFRNDIINLPDLRRDNVTGNKRINDITHDGNYFYLSTGLGVIVIDPDRAEIRETWLIGANGGQVNVNGVATDGSLFYAATDEGLKEAPASAALADFTNWHSVLLGPGTAPCQTVINAGSHIFALRNDSLYSKQSTDWQYLYSDGWNITHADYTGGMIALCQRNNSGQARVTLLQPDGTPSATLQQASLIREPQRALIDDGITWIADRETGLIRYDGGQFDRFELNAPAGIATGRLASREDRNYAAAGAVDENWAPLHDKDGFFIFQNGAWQNINRNSLAAMDSVNDIIDLAVDPRDASVWGASVGGGLLQWSPDNNVQVYKQGILESPAALPGSYRVGGLAFDRENNLWLTNYGASSPLLAHLPNGNWEKMDPPSQIPDTAFTSLLIDDSNLKWIIARSFGLVGFDHGNSIENKGDDRWTVLRTGAGNGNLPGQVNCLAKDKNGFIWIGTDNGIGVMQCATEVFTAQGCEAVWPVVQQGAFAGYLFSGENISSIAVDGANRKWVASKNGVWLISATGEQVINYFNTGNSPLLSNDVRQIAIAAQTGEVFFATASGLCSFRGSATEGTEINSDLLVFPNPVPPGYSGTIAIRGVAQNAIVKITEPDGRLVFQMRALGGQAVWDGRDYRGRKISTGVYLILVSGEDRKAKIAGKIMYIGK